MENIEAIKGLNVQRDTYQVSLVRKGARSAEQSRTDGRTWFIYL